MQKRIINKNGSHVGMVLSFVMFVTALIFIYSILQPSIITGEDKSQLVKQIEDKLPDYINSQLFNLRLSYNGCCGISTCFYLLKPKEVKLMNFTAKDREGKIVDSLESGANIYFEKNSGNYTSVFFSLENFSKSESNIQASDCYEITPDEYNSSFTSKDYAFDSKIVSFISNLSDKNFYTSKKNEFSLPSGTEFSLVFVYQNGSRIGGVKENISTNVFVDEVSIYYVNSSADINPGFIDIGVW